MLVRGSLIKVLLLCRTILKHRLGSAGAADGLVDALTTSGALDAAEDQKERCRALIAVGGVVLKKLLKAREDGCSMPTLEDALSMWHRLEANRYVPLVSWN